ncbi:MAG: hypothetical protein ACK5MY_06005 [Jhaorihella sp.]
MTVRGDIADKTDGRPPRRLILHCGVQKTGSTSLQRFLQRNSEALRGHVEVLTPVRGSLTRDLGHTAMQFSLDPSARMQRRLSRLGRALRDTLLPGPGAGPVLVSHENLPGAMIGKGGVVTLYPQLEGIMGLLDAALHPLVPEYVFYTRDMAGWKRSVYNQAVRSDLYAAPFAAFLDETGGCGGWADLEARLLDGPCAGRVLFLRLEDEADPARPGRQLLAHAGLTPDVVDRLVPLRLPGNQSPRASAIEFLRQLNGLGLERACRGRVAALVAENEALFAP